MGIDYELQRQHGEDRADWADRMDDIGDAMADRADLHGIAGTHDYGFHSRAQIDGARNTAEAFGDLNRAFDLIDFAYLNRPGIGCSSTLAENTRRLSNLNRWIAEFTQLRARLEDTITRQVA